MPVYALVVGKDGHKLNWSSDPTSGQSAVATAPAAPSDGVATIQTPFGPISGKGLTVPAKPRGALLASVGSELVGTNVDMAYLAGFLSRQLDSPVIDKTGLTGLFDFKMHYTVDALALVNPGPPAGPTIASDPSGPSIFTAVQEIGLKLESSKSPIEVLVVDSVRRPTEN